MKSFVYSIACLLVATLVSCNSKSDSDKLPTEYLKPATVAFTNQDTVNISSEVTEYVEKLRQSDFEGCANMLYKVDGESVTPLSDSEKRSFVRAMSMLPIKEVSCNAMILRDSLNNSYKLTVTLEGKNPDEEAPVTHFYLNPVLREGNWYLTTLDENAQGVQKVYKR